MYIDLPLFVKNELKHFFIIFLSNFNLKLKITVYNLKQIINVYVVYVYTNT